MRFWDIVMGGCGSNRLDRNVIRMQPLEKILLILRTLNLPWKLDATVVSGCDFIHFYVQILLDKLYLLINILLLYQAETLFYND